jgi:hypothetical protein
VLTWGQIAMFNPATVRLMHPHGDEMVPMVEVPREGPSDAATFDVERELLRGARVFRCPVCEERVHVALPGAGPGQEE